MRHYVWDGCHGISAWGHTAPGHACIAKFLQSADDLEISLTFNIEDEAKITEDWSLYPQHLLKRLRLIPMGNPDTPRGFANMAAKSAELAAELRRFLKHAEPTPSRVVVDQASPLVKMEAIGETLPHAEIWVFRTRVLRFARYGTTETSLSVWLKSYSNSASAPNGGADLEAVAKRLGGGDEILYKAMMTRNGKAETDGTLVSIPGLGEMYDYEREMTNIPIPPHVLPFLYKGRPALDKAHGVLQASSNVLEGDTLDACRQLETRRLVVVGDCVSPRSWSGSTCGGAIKSFLDKQKAKSVVLISFGSMHFPMEEPLSAVLDGILGLGHPVLFNAPSPDAVTSAILTRLKTVPPEKLFLNLGWLDQIGVLNHTAIACFLTHGGWGSVKESIVANVPMIVYPVAGHGDQMLNAQHVSLREKPFGIELMQIRSDKRPPRRGCQILGTREAIVSEIQQVVNRMLGPDGDVFRSNMERAKEQMRAEMEHTETETIMAFLKSE